MEILAALLIFNIMLFIFILFVLLLIRKILRKGNEVSTISKRLILTLGGLIGARVVRALLKKVL